MTSLIVNFFVILWDDSDKITDFYGRPFSVIMASTIVDKILESIEDEELKKKPLQAVALDIKINSEDFTDINLYNILKM